MPNGIEFENLVGARLDALFPHSRLSKVLLFRPDLGEERRYGFEIDHLLHARDGLLDRLFIVECKDQPIDVDGGEWYASYDGQQKTLKRQLQNQAVSLLRHLNEKDPGRQLRVEACIVSSHQATSYLTDVAADERVNFHLFGLTSFANHIRHHRDLIQRIEQSTILTELRMGCPIAELGRPDIANAISFVQDCRRLLDHELFRQFPGWSSHAAINGTAGMGKSVMLAYILFVLSCDFYVKADDTTGKRALLPFAERAASLGLPPHSQRSMVAFGMSQKQVAVLQVLWRHFVRLFGSLENGHLLHFHQPVFRVWDAKIPDECNVLAVDEAHDLKLAAQHIIRDWKNEDSESRYLLVACDRHQRLRLSGHGSRIIDGLDFSGRTLRLRRNYRSPFPVYAASLGLMFRWFAKSGPKIIPPQDELTNSFGFKIESAGAAGDWILADINDSHPGNHWCYTVSRFFSPDDALRQIQPLQGKDVLWVRFSAEDALFDYEQLSSFTYHPMEGGGSPALIDKYIKGQEFSVVVIEGLPPASVAELPETSGNSPNEEEKAMWQSRRELYLCASRANVFLLFVLKSGEPGEEEMESLLANLRKPDEPEKRLWRLKFTDGRPIRRPIVIDHFDDQAPHETTVDATPAIIRLTLRIPLTVRSLVTSLEAARGLGLQTALRQALDAVGKLGLTALSMDTVIPVERLRELEESLGVLIDVEGDDGGAPTMPTDAPIDPSMPSGLRLGITVEQAASILGVSTQRLLELLPVAYHARHVLDRDADLLRLHPIWQTTRQPAPQQSPPPARQSLDVWQSALGKELWNRTQRPEFVGARTMIDKYVMLLSELVRIKPEAESILLAYRPRGGTYFAKSHSEILRDRPYASIKKLPTSGIYVMCTLSNDSKLNVLRKVLGDSGLRSTDIRRLLDAF